MVVVINVAQKVSGVSQPSIRRICVGSCIENNSLTLYVGLVFFKSMKHLLSRVLCVKILPFA